MIVISFFIFLSSAGSSRGYHDKVYVACSYANEIGQVKSAL